MSTPQQKRKMTYVRLGQSGLKVSRIILGTMSYGSKDWASWVLEEEEGLKHIKAAYDAGIQTFDTANVYSNGASEIILGKAIKKFNLPRDEIVIMTKVFFLAANTPSENFITNGLKSDEYGYVNQKGLSRKHIFDSIKKSLARLQLDYVDVLQCHRFDPETPIAETMQALHDVVKAGYARYIGMSSCWAWQFAAMQNYALNNNLTPFISMQNHHSLVYREEEREMMPTLRHFGVGAIPWSPLARGLLTRPVNQQKEKTVRQSTDWFQPYKTSNPSTAEIVNRVEELSKKKGVSMAQIAIAWSLAQDPIAAPIVGTTHLDNLNDIIGAIDVQLSPEEVKYLSEPYEALAVAGHA